MLGNYTTFWREFWRNYHTTGAVAPSGPWLAQALSSFVEHNGNGQPREILEVGPGTGAVTQYLVQHLQPQDQLTLVELNDTFVAHLEERFRTEPAFKAVAPRTRIVHERLESLGDERRYDVIVSGLPLNNFEPDEVANILAIFDRLLTPTGTLSFFEYVGMRPLKLLVTGGADRARVRGVGRAMADFLGPREFRRDLVLRNVTPAWVHHARRTATPA